MRGGRVVLGTYLLVSNAPEAERALLGVVRAANIREAREGAAVVDADARVIALAHGTPAEQQEAAAFLRGLA